MSITANNCSSKNSVFVNCGLFYALLIKARFLSVLEIVIICIYLHLNGTSNICVPCIDPIYCDVISLNNKMHTFILQLNFQAMKPNRRVEFMNLPSWGWQTSQEREDICSQGPWLARNGPRGGKVKLFQGSSLCPWIYPISIL